MVGKGVLSPPSAAQCWLLMAGVELLPAKQVSCRSASSDKETDCSPVYNKVICKKVVLCDDTMFLQLELS